MSQVRPIYDCGQGFLTDHVGLTVGIVTGGVVPEEGKEDRHRFRFGDLPLPFTAGQYLALVTQRRWTHRQPMDDERG